MSEVINVASVPQLSPFRYPGGKTWLTPWIRLWLRKADPRTTTLVDVFAGGGSVSLAAVFENLVGQAIMIELDENIASVWSTILDGDGCRLAEKVVEFDCTARAVTELLSLTPKSIEEQAFRTLVMNRTRYGGIIAPGSAPVKRGEKVMVFLLAGTRKHLTDEYGRFQRGGAGYFLSLETECSFLRWPHDIETRSII